MLPVVGVDQISGNYMFFNTRKGTIMNQHGADGLKAHLDFNRGSDEFDESTICYRDGMESNAHQGCTQLAVGKWSFLTRTQIPSS
jgi:hypothetical protein